VTEGTQKWTSKSVVLSLIAISISSSIFIVLVYSTFFSPPNVVMTISAIGSNAKVTPNYSKIAIDSYSPTEPNPVTFLIKLVNDGGRSAENVHVRLGYQPGDPDWLNPGTVPMQTQNYLPCTLGEADGCFIGIIPKGESVIVGFSGSLNYQEYEEIREQNPQIILSYWYDGSKVKQQPIIIRMGE
jgi:hypothetical protein